MDITLPVTRYTVTLHDYVPQRVFEAYQERLARHMRIDLKDAHVTVERVAEELGADRAAAIQNSPSDAERKLLLDEARKEILLKTVTAQINVADQHAAEREKVRGMVKSVRDGDTSLGDFDLGELPRTDYALVQEKVAEIESREEEQLGKASGQSDA